MVRVIYVLVVLLGVAYVVWPYGFLVRLYVALDSSDEVAVEGLVDWGAVRTGFEEDLDAAARSLAGRQSEAAAFKGLRLTWRSSPTMKRIAALLASPRGMIALFESPAMVRCVLAGETATCEGAVNSAVEQRRQKEFRLKGPNVGRILDKVTFAFFTGPFTFELDVRHENIPVVVVVERRSLGWLVSRVRLPVAALLDGPR